MLKVMGWLLLFGLSFGAGYWAGQRPVGELKEAVADLSQRVVEQTGEMTRKAVATTSGFEQRLRLRQRLVEAKARLVSAKSDLLDKNFGSATKEFDALAAELERIPDDGATQTRALVTALKAHVRDARRQVAVGKPVAKPTLDQIQRKLEELGQRADN